MIPYMKLRLFFGRSHGEVWLYVAYPKEWANLDDIDQSVATTDAVTFATVDTGQGANELYDMDQNVETTDDVEFQSTLIDQNGNGVGLSIDNDDVFLKIQKIIQYIDSISENHQGRTAFNLIKTYLKMHQGPLG